MATDRPHVDAALVCENHQIGVGVYGGDPTARPTDGNCIESALGTAGYAACQASDDGTTFDHLHYAAGLLFYIARNNCFLDGNKRAGWITATEYLLQLGLVVNAADDEVVAFVLRIAKGEVTRDQVFVWLTKDGRLQPYMPE